MKKFSILLIMIFFVSGCGTKHITCTSTKKDTDVSTVIHADLKNKTVTYASVDMTYLTTEAAKNMCNVYKKVSDSDGNVECDEYHVYLKNYQKSIDAKDLEKDRFMELMQQQNYECK